MLRDGYGVDDGVYDNIYDVITKYCIFFHINSSLLITKIEPFLLSTTCADIEWHSQQTALGLRFDIILFFNVLRQRTNKIRYHVLTIVPARHTATSSLVAQIK